MQPYPARTRHSLTKSTQVTITYLAHHPLLESGLFATAICVTNALNRLTAISRKPGHLSGTSRTSASPEMKMPSPLSRLPASLLLLLSTQIRHIHADTQRLPTAIRKMGTDAQEKFLHEYLAFGEEDTILEAGTELLAPAEEALLAANSSASMSHYRAPLAAHFSLGSRGVLDERDAVDPWEWFSRARIVEARLARRDFACPTGTSSCSSIGYANSCCPYGDTCVQIADTGLGPVGCCPTGVSCTGTIACSGDQEGCSSESGGGCCIPGWSCASVGCKSPSNLACCVVLTQATQAHKARQQQHPPQPQQVQRHRRP